jgi:hypothetical protein
LCSRKKDKKGKDKKESGKYNYNAKGFLNKSGDLQYPLFYLDTCTTFSMTGDKEILTNIRPWKAFVSGGDKSSKGNIITAIGDLKLNIVNNCGEVLTVEIPNIRFVEDFEVTLIRPQQLYKEIGIISDFYNNVIIGPDERIIGNIGQDGMCLPYIVNCSVEVEKGKGFVSRDIWHERFGHISMEYIDSMKKNDIVVGLNVSEHKECNVEKCETCYIMNNRRNNFKRIEEKKIRNFGEVISVDIDELPVMSVEGFYYRLDIICHGSNWIWTFGLKRKSDATVWIVFIIK